MIETIILILSMVACFVGVFLGVFWEREKHNKKCVPYIKKLIADRDKNGYNFNLAIKNNNKLKRSNKALMDDLKNIKKYNNTETSQLNTKIAELKKRVLLFNLIETEDELVKNLKDPLCRTCNNGLCGVSNRTGDKFMVIKCDGYSDRNLMAANRFNSPSDQKRTP